MALLAGEREMSILRLLRRGGRLLLLSSRGRIGPKERNALLERACFLGGMGKEKGLQRVEEGGLP